MGPRACVRTRGVAPPAHLGDCPHSERRLSPIFRTQHYLQAGTLLLMRFQLGVFRCFANTKKIPENSGKTILSNFQKFRNGDFFVAWREKAKTHLQIDDRNYSYLTWKALCTLDLL